MNHPYASTTYAEALGHMGHTLAVPEWGGHILTRAIEDSGARDAVGPYPLTVLPPDADLVGGLERLKAAGLLSVVAVLDPLQHPPIEAIKCAFDLARPFKTHHIHDRSLGPPAYAKHHRYEVRRAQTRVEAREIDLADHLPDWIGLYDLLISRHQLTGVHAFPTSHHRALAELPGVRAFGAFIDDHLVSAHLFVTHAGQATSHLAASSAEGYAAGAAYAVNDLALERLDDCELINFGGGAGAGDDPNDGLSRFKAGFANTRRTVWLCGAILDPDACRTLSAGREDNGFFPAYRGPTQEERSDADQG
ncbi:MAG: GNAT family N-acetyltransferase [Brevundimonas sp.]|uniref:GNAT family N-acetyltransferase n=1 Tax=Brevundimonas sp. TaxID=1871086 RepID=UPI0027336C30|nr:GNAT family N-acetyltransferase [Brevundimonas sp.]MDP3404147.1 GNAT family N-acetyltransferase [Brevundimonas sp.]